MPFAPVSAKPLGFKAFPIYQDLPVLLGIGILKGLWVFLCFCQSCPSTTALTASGSAVWCLRGSLPCYNHLPRENLGAGQGWELCAFCLNMPHSWDKCVPPDKLGTRKIVTGAVAVLAITMRSSWHYIKKSQMCPLILGGNEDNSQLLEK